MLRLLVFSVMIFSVNGLCGQVNVDEINFVRQGSKRLIFDTDQSLPLARLDPSKLLGQASMHPIKHHLESEATVDFSAKSIVLESQNKTATSIWLGGFNPFATYTISSRRTIGQGHIGFEFSDQNSVDEFRVLVEYSDSLVTNVTLEVSRGGILVTEKSISVNLEIKTLLKGDLILQMLGSGLTLYLRNEGLPIVIGQSDFNNYLDLREKKYINSFHSNVFVRHSGIGHTSIASADVGLSTGVGLADIRAITFENGKPFLDGGRLWYSMSIRGRALPHHIQGVFSMNPSLFDVRLEGIIVFDRGDGLLRNEVASHLFYDRNDQKWKGMTTGFSAYARPDVEKKQLLLIESEVDPRFGFSIMQASSFGVVGDIEDPHIIYDENAKKWRMLTCENIDGYKAIVMESDFWNRGYERIAGPVAHNSTGTSIQKIDGVYYCFSGSSERKIWIYSYPDLEEIGTLKMDLPPWDDKSGTRVWPNVVQLPEGYPFRYVALMMDRYNYPGLKGPNWSYGALYLYHGSE